MYVTDEVALPRPHPPRRPYVTHSLSHQGQKEKVQKRKVDKISTHKHDDIQDIKVTQLKLNRNIEAIKHLHHSMGHRSVKRLIALKKHGKVITANLTSQMLKEYNYS